MDDLEIEDGSNDKAYFTMVPNIVLNHSSAVDQALYMQMKRFAGEKRGGGHCGASKRTLMLKLGVGLKALNASIDYLVSHNWISPAGVRQVMTNGGPQDIQMYRVNDIWKMNTDHYKGASESAPLAKGVAESRKGVLESTQGVAESATTKNNIKINTSEFEDEPRRVEVPEEDRPKRTSTAKYPHSKEVFSWFPKDLYEPSWKINTALLKHSELLYSRGESKVRSIIKFCLANESDSFFPTWQDPLTLERNWNKIVRFADKND